MRTHVDNLINTNPKFVRIFAREYTCKDIYRSFNFENTTYIKDVFKDTVISFSPSEYVDNHMFNGNFFFFAFGIKIKINP